MSLPTRERGLKLDIDGKETTIRKIVAPYAGAWIEIFIEMILPNGNRVAPYAGAWIEIRILGTLR